MVIFAVLAIYLFLVDVFIDSGKRGAKSLLSAMGFVLLLALRSPYCGVDLLSGGSYIGASYWGTFVEMQSIKIVDLVSFSTSSHFEIGFLFLTKIITLFTWDFQIYLTILALLQFIPIAYIFYKYSANIVFSYFIFAGLGFFVFYFSGLRQALAMSITLLAMDKFYNRNIKAFIAYTIFASVFHISAVVFVLLWPISKLKLRFSSAIIILVVIALLIPLYNRLGQDVVSLLFGGNKYSNYFDNSGVAITMYVVYGLIFLFSFIIKRKDDYIMILRSLALLGVVCQSLGSISTGAITRIGYYFSFFFSLLIPEIVLVVDKSKMTRNVVVFGAMMLLCIFFYLTTKDGYLDVVPYNFFWERPLI